MMQPAFMPWQGFFELIYKAGRFIFLDNFQFSVQSYHQRNRMFVNKGQVGWYTVPMQKGMSFGAPLNEAKINESTAWRKKMAKAIRFNYLKAPYFNEIFPYIEKWLLTPAASLAAQNISFIKLVCGLLGFEREFLCSSAYQAENKRSLRVLELLRWSNASHYFCAQGSFEYMHEDNVFPVSDVEILFQDFKPQPYAQAGAVDAFVPYLSILDALMNIGAADSAELVRGGTSKWLTWEDMVQLRKLSGKEAAV